MSENEFEDKLKKIEEEMFQFNNRFNSLREKYSRDYGALEGLSYINHGIRALYLQNKVLIEQQKEIVNYMKKYQEDKE